MNAPTLIAPTLTDVLKCPTCALEEERLFEDDPAFVAQVGAPPEPPPFEPIAEAEIADDDLFAYIPQTLPPDPGVEEDTAHLAHTLREYHAREYGERVLREAHLACVCREARATYASAPTYAVTVAMTATLYVRAATDDLARQAARHAVVSVENDDGDMIPLGGHIVPGVKLVDFDATTNARSIRVELDEAAE